MEPPVVTWRLALGFVLAVALIVAPGAFDATLGGTPLGAPGRVAICVIFLAWIVTRLLPPRRAPGSWVVVALVLLIGAKLLMGAASAPTGWRGEYRFGDQRGGTADAEFSWRFGTHGFRIDRAVAFGPPNFNLHFLNDVGRFGYPPYSTMPREIEFPLDVRWTGHVLLARPAHLVLTARAAGELRVALDGSTRALQNPSKAEWRVELPSGIHVVEVRYRKPGGVAPEVFLNVVDAATSTPITVSPWGGAPRRPSWMTDGATDVVVLVGLLLSLVGLAVAYARAGTVIDRRSMPGCFLAVSAVAVVTSWTASLSVRTLGLTTCFNAGNDSLTYASNARNILTQGVLMLGGSPLGHAAPFYHYPLYPYLLAGMHALVGDDVSTIYLLNGLAMALLPVLFWRLGWRTLTPFAAATGLVLLVAFIHRYSWPILSASEAAYTDFVFLAIVFAALAALARACTTPSPGRLLAAGAMIAIGAATRPSFLTMVGFAPIALLAASSARSTRTWVVATAWLMAGVLLGLLPFTLRNLVASGRFVVLVNSWIQIPYFLVPPESVERPQGSPGLVQALLMAKDILLRDPMGTLWVEARKLLFTMGFTTFGPHGGAAGKLFVLPVLFAVSAFFRRIPRVLLIVLVAFAASHVVAMVMAAPWTSGLKSIQPLHAAFLFGAVYLLDRPHRAPATATASR
jgi:hypothetical protein